MRLKSVGLLAVEAGTSFALGGGEVPTTGSGIGQQSSISMTACNFGICVDLLPVVVGTLACGGFCVHTLGIIVGGVGALTDSFGLFAMKAWCLLAGLFGLAQASWRQVAGGVGGCRRNFDLILRDYRWLWGFMVVFVPAMSMLFVVFAIMFY